MWSVNSAADDDEAPSDPFLLLFHYYGERGRSCHSSAQIVPKLTLPQTFSQTSHGGSSYFRHHGPHSPVPRRCASMPVLMYVFAFACVRARAHVHAPMLVLEGGPNSPSRSFNASRTSPDTFASDVSYAHSHACMHAFECMNVYGSTNTHACTQSQLKVQLLGWGSIAAWEARSSTCTLTRTHTNANANAYMRTCMDAHRRGTGLCGPWCRKCELPPWEV